MKKIFKLAAVAVSLALAAGLAACSSGDDDVVDATTPKYLLAAQIDQYFNSVKYDQNVPEDDKAKKALKTAHDTVMGVLGDCDGCLAAYLGQLKKNVANTEPLTSEDIVEALSFFEKLQGYKTHDEYERVYVYKPAIEAAVKAVEDALGAKDKVNTVADIQDLDIAKDGILNLEQVATVKAYIDAVKALEGALSEDKDHNDKKACEKTIKDANDAIKVFEDLKNKGVTAEKIATMTEAVTAMTDDINTKVVKAIKNLLAEDSAE